MGKGGGTPPPQQVTTTTSNLPTYAKPYFQSLLTRGEALSQAPFTPYTGTRIAGRTATGGVAEARAVASGTDPLSSLSASEQALLGTTKRRELLPNVQLGAENISELSRAIGGQGQEIIDASSIRPDAERFSEIEQLSAALDPAARITQYSDPYLEQVLRGQERSAQRRFAEAQSGRDQRAIQAGAFGGSRRSVADALARRDLDERLDKMGAEARSEAFRTGLGAAERQQALLAKAREAALDARLQAGRTELDERLGVQTRAQQAAQEAQQLRLRQAEAADRARLGAADSLTEQIAARQALRERQAAQLAAVGEAERQRQQTTYDQAFADFVDQRDAPRQQLQFLSSLLRGTPITAESAVIKRQAPPSPASSLLGLGLGAAGLSRLLG